MTPFINLTPREIDVMSSLLKHRYELSKKIPDPIMVGSILMNNDTREKVLEECGISVEHFYVIMNNLRNKGYATKQDINPELIPNISKDNNGYCQLLLLFKDDIIK
jgi:hypothetical protein